MYINVITFTFINDACPYDLNDRSNRIKNQESQEVTLTM